MSEQETSNHIDRIVDEQALTTYLEDKLGRAESYSIEHHREGHSNETLFVAWGDTNLIIRRPPPGGTADTAHDVLREYRVMDALQETKVHVPKTIASCDDHSVLGSDFYVMEQQPGDVIRTAELERFRNPAHRQKLGLELVKQLVAIHQVNYQSVGLGGFGSPQGFTNRQVDRWRKQIEWATDVTADDREVPALAEVTQWLESNIPDNHPETLIHGDYKLDNVIFAPGTPPKIGGVFDWELSTLGDPFTDLGWMLSFWRDAKDPAPPASTGDLYPTFMTCDDYATRQELVQWYEELSGRQFEHETFYRVLAVYKMAALGEMFYRRYLEGNSNDPLYPKMENGVPELAERSINIIEGEEPL